MKIIKFRENIKIVVEGIKKIEGKYYNCGGGNKKNGGGKRGKKNIACFL